MAIQHKRTRRRQSGFAIGRDAMEKISAVEGIVFPDEMKRQFDEFDRLGLTDEERIEAIKKQYGVKG